MNRELIHTEEREGFTIQLWRRDEDMSPRGQFQREDGSDDEELIHDIESGRYDWFCAEVTASKADVVLGHDFLGGCCYESAKDFVTPDGYYPDMVAEAIAEAREKLAELCGKED
jgi:hypothetical protein